MKSSSVNPSFEKRGEGRFPDKRGLMKFKAQRAGHTGESRYPAALRCSQYAKVARFRVKPGMTAKAPVSSV
jgi:hypothetical protein